MKITQTDSKMEIKTNGILQVFFGFILAIVGAVVAYTVLTGMWKIQGNGQSTSIIGPIVGIIMIVGGIVAAFLAHNTDTTLQKGGVGTVNLKHVLFGKTHNMTFETNRIKAVCLMTRYQSNNSINSSNRMSSGTKRSSQLSLMLDDNSLILIASSSSGGGTSMNGINITSLVTRAPLSKQANQIAQFLGVPLQSSGDLPSLADIGNIVSVVKEGMQENQAPVEPTTPVEPANPTVEAAKPPEHPNWHS